MLFYIKKLIQCRKQSSQRPLEQDFCLQSGLEVSSKIVCEQMISPSRRQAAIDCTGMRPKLPFKDLKHLLGMEVGFILFFLSDAKYLGHLEAGEGREASVFEHQSWGKTQGEVPGWLTELPLVELGYILVLSFLSYGSASSPQKRLFSLLIYGLRNVKSSICITNISNTPAITA